MPTTGRNLLIALVIVFGFALAAWLITSQGHRMSGAPGTAAAGASSAGGKPGAGGHGMASEAVVVAPVTSSGFAREMEALGTARANESVDITAKVSNRIAAIHFTEGQQVKAGAVLLELDALELRADLAAAQAAFTESRSQYNRSRELLLTKALSASQMDQILATLQSNEAKVASAQSRLNDSIIRAPFAGRVGLRRVSLGSFVSSGTVITTLDDTRVIKLDFSVPETFLATVTEGLEVTARSSAYPRDVFIGKVSSIDSRIDPVSRSVIVRALLDNGNGRLKPGMFLTLKLTHPSEQALMLLEQALVPENDKQFVYAVREGKAHKIQITTGRRRPGEVEVLSGLKAGDSVVIEGTQKLRDGAMVRVVASQDELARAQ